MNGRDLLAGLVVTAVAACAAAKPVGPPVAPDERGLEREGWPDSWAVEFGLRCAASGEDVRYCACVAKEIQRRWTPEQFEALDPEGLQEEVRRCRDRLGGAGAE